MALAESSSGRYISSNQTTLRTHLGQRPEVVVVRVVASKHRQVKLARHCAVLRQLALGVLRLCSCVAVDADLAVVRLVSLNHVTSTLLNIRTCNCYLLSTANMESMETSGSALATGSIASRFITQDDVDEAKERREQEWKDAYAR